jgi:hypothetical protein
MANPQFAMTLLGMVILAALVPAGTAQAAPDLFLPPGQTLQVAGAAYNDVVVLGTLVLDDGAALVAQTLTVLEGGRIEARSGMPGRPAVADVALGEDGEPGADLRIQAGHLHVAAGATLAAGSGGAGGSALGQASATGGAGGRGGSVLVDATTVRLDGALLPGAGGQGGHAVLLASSMAGQAFQATGGAGGDSGFVSVNGAAWFGGLPEVAAPRTSAAASPLCLVTVVTPLGCELPETPDLARWLDEAIDCPGPSSAQQASASVTLPLSDCVPDVRDVKPFVDSALAFVAGCWDDLGLGQPASSSSSSLQSFETSSILDSLEVCELAGQTAAVIQSEVREATADAQRLAQTCQHPMVATSTLLPGWSSCSQLAGMLVDGAVDSAVPGLPGAPGLTRVSCATAMGTSAPPSAGGGGKGGDACVTVEGQDGAHGSDGASGVFGCSSGGSGGNGGSAGAATAVGGAGGTGVAGGGAGGSATANSFAGKGGNGGDGGTRWGDPDCAGGAGGKGGDSADTTAVGGAGGHGICGPGGDGGLADTDSRPGSGGTGGSGTPPGTPGLPGTGGAETAQGGPAGIRGSC